MLPPSLRLLNCLLFIGCRLGRAPPVEDVLIGPKRGQGSSDLTPAADCMSLTYVCVLSETEVAVGARNDLAPL